MNGLTYFERLVASAERITRHAQYPGKDEALEQCVEDIDDLALAGRITDEERYVLRAILRGEEAHSHAA